ncbi:MAG: aminopeptidase, partial [Lachnospiraceae bacterium]
LNILGAHVDSPRIDIKQVPLFEEQGYAYLDTHYYGGIKKFQWLVLPLALHGIVVKKDGTKVDIVIGEKEDDPVFVITDILPHLGKEQRKKTAEEFINGEKMDLLIGNRPLKGTEKDPVKATILEFLKKNYKLEEQDFLSAELEIVPAGKARDCGLDRSMIIGYGQDDRVCAFTSVLAMLETKDTKRTTCCILVDKEEIGSVGASGMTSKFFENAIAELVDRTGEYSELQVRRTLANSRMLSSDVSAAYDPMYAECYEKRNSAYLGEGLVFNKYTGSGGKSGSNDANPEYMAKMRNIMDSNHITWQTAELGAVDIGGGGTIAYLMAEYMMDVIDSGIAVLNMHAPWEVTSKADIYEGVKGYGVFLKEA